MVINCTTTLRDQTLLVVGVHGAGLVNLIWCRSGAEVVEILPDDFRKTTFLHMSAEHGLGYTPFFGSKEGHNQAFTVDVPALTALVDRCLEARERSLQKKGPPEGGPFRFRRK